ncbi:AraC family transcriptional regulator [Allorhodopirellula solitaria]|uniref:Xylose operon regulatory protein n=1 Tax=Allorhodopirellula solitaria TaxID=2527987 RepID=A0A5C5XPW4_9BACT|nr:DNA-binding transcriptional regulator [Allorhodopirellula solitaria]TWT65266.1 Xylose operon regulatory protein [Allorhodopirellula solitaria]
MARTNLPCTTGRGRSADPVLLDERNVLLALNVYNAEIHRGVAKFGRDHRWHIPADLEDPIPRSWSGDGVLTHLGAPQEIWRRLRRFDVPIVDLAESRPQIRLPRVTIDNAAVGHAAADFFLDRGYRHFAFVHRWELGASQRRRDHFRARVVEAGFECEILSWGKEGSGRPDTPEQRRRWMKQRLSRLKTPLAVFASRDVEAVMVIDACLELGLLVPDQIAVLGVGNSEAICECLRVPLSSIEDNSRLVGYEGAALLERLMQGESPPANPLYIPPGKIVERRSTDSLAVEHPQVVAALRFIHDNFSRPIGMADVVKHVAMSRSGLERAFREHSIRPPMEELRHIRLTRAKAMLGESDEKIAAIARITGFQTPHNLCRTFRKQIGLTPREFRSQNRAASSAAV